MRIGIAAVQGVFDSGLSALLDVFSTANTLNGQALFEVQRLGDGAYVTSAQGARHRTVHWASAKQRFHHLVLPGFGAKAATDVQDRLPALASRQLLRLVERVHAAGGGVHAACTGTWLLARSGLLDGRQATTSWWFADAFQRAFPRVRLEPQRMLVRSGPFTTAGAALAHVDLAISLVHRSSPSLAARVADFLLTDHRGTQAPYLLGHVAPSEDPLVQAFERAVRGSVEASFDLAALSRSLHTSPRTLQRRLRSSVGKSPLKFVQHVRLQRALELLRSGRDSVDAIAERVGYQSGHTLRQLIRRELGTGVRELKARVG
jgi:transcriptional regulator GlxA family with amidase domain